MDKIYLIHVPFLCAWWGNMIYLAWEIGQGPFALYQVSEKAILASETWCYPTYCPRVWPCPKGYQGAMALLRGDRSMVCSGFPDMPLRAVIQAWASGSPKASLGLLSFEAPPWPVGPADLVPLMQMVMRARTNTVRRMPPSWACYGHQII